VKIHRLLIPLGAGLLLAGGTLVAFARGAALPPPPNVSETALLPGGYASAIHPDAAGQLWITEASSATVRRYDPVTRVFTLYTGLTNTVDAQLGPDGKLWWLDPPDRLVARMDTATRLVTTWPLSTSFSTALAFDSLNRAWVADFVSFGLYRLNPSTDEYCDVDLPDNGASETLVAHNGALWVGDEINGRLGRITPTTNNFTYWSLAFAGGFSDPLGFAFAPNGDVWWADAGLAKLGRLEPGANHLTLFTPPGTTTPIQVAYQFGKVWFTDLYSGTLGYVDSALAVGDGPHTVTPVSSTLAPACVTIGHGPTFTAGTSSGVASFSAVTFTTTVDARGTLYTLPHNGQPYPLAAVGTNVWVGDVGRSRLLRLDNTPRLYLPFAQR
jgi:streptogramin lyase